MTQEPTSTYTAPPSDHMTPVTPVRSGGGSGRVIAALVATLLVAAVVVGGLFLANRGGSAAAASTASGYLPADTLAYFEVRLDRPGDQKQNLANVLSRFPGFKDQASFEQKWDDVLNRAVTEISKNKYTYPNDVKPWFGGQLSVGISAPAGSASIEDKGPLGLAVMSIIDRAKAEAQFEKFRTDSGKTFTSQDHNGTKVWSAPVEGEGEMATQASYAVTADAAIFGTTPDQVKAALDVKSGKGQSLTSLAQFTDGMKKLRGDRLTAFYVDMTGFARLVETQAAADPSAAPMREQVRAALAQLPKAVVGEIHTESDKFSGEFRGIGAPAEMRPTVGTSKVATRLPGTGVLAYFEVHDIARTIRQAVTQLKSAAPSPEPGESPAADQIEEFLGAPLDSAFDWVGDAGMAVSLEGLPRVSMVATTSDENVARTRLDKLVGQLRSLDESLVTEKDHSGTKVTTLNFGGLTGGAGGGAVPSTLSYAIKNGAVLIGLGGNVVEGMLDQPETSSLSNDARYKAAIAAADAETNGGFAFVDISAIRRVGESFLQSGDMKKQYDEIRPYLEPLDLFVATTLVDGEDVLSRVVLTVK
jgi:hypothetical protein